MRKNKFQVNVEDGGALNQIEYSAGTGYEDTLAAQLKAAHKEIEELNIK
jgi:hypothetical protein